MHIAIYAYRIYSYKVVDNISCLSVRLKFTMFVTEELLIFSLGDYHKVAVSCVSYPWPCAYD